MFNIGTGLGDGVVAVTDVDWTEFEKRILSDGRWNVIDKFHFVDVCCEKRN